MKAGLSGRLRWSATLGTTHDGTGLLQVSKNGVKNSFSTQFAATLLWNCNDSTFRTLKKKSYPSFVCLSMYIYNYICILYILHKYIYIYIYMYIYIYATLVWSLSTHRVPPERLLPGGGGSEAGGPALLAWSKRYCGWLRNPFRTTVQKPWNDSIPL